MVSASLIVLFIRTRKPLFQSRPGGALMLATLIAAAATIALLVTPLAPLFGFRPLSPAVIAALAAIIVFYVFSAKMTKRTFYKRVEGELPP